MRAQDEEYARFANLTAPEFAGLLALAKLSSEDKEIAAQRIVWRMNYIDIAVAVHMDRRTVARRLKKTILPELERMVGRTETMKAGA